MRLIRVSFSFSYLGKADGDDVQVVDENNYSKNNKSHKCVLIYMFKFQLYFSYCKYKKIMPIFCKYTLPNTCITIR